MSVDIGPKIGIDGEAEFRKELGNINQQLRTLGSEMKAVTSARRMGEPLLARAAGGGRALYRPEPEGFSLAFPYAETRAFPLTPLFCFARVERMNGEFYAVFPFWSGGCPRLPHKPAQAGQTIGANQTKEETRHGEPNHQGADRPVRPAQF